ncbi:MAG: YidC/Oxa1 family membrane protein insertase [Patescibacteria group bacterium]|mgnify:CR=1 FL=1
MIIGEFFNETLHRPLINLLVGLYNTIGFQDLGVAIILLTVLVRLLLFPIFQKSLRHQKQLKELQPKMKELQEKYKKDPKKQTTEVMALYKTAGVNPFSGMILLVVQLPILIALYRIFLRGLSPIPILDLYSFVDVPAGINATLFGLINLNERSILMVVAAAVAQYVQGKITLAAQSQNSASSMDRVARSMVLVGPLMTVVIFFGLPAAVPLYWFVSSLVSVVQQMIVNKESLSQHAVGSIHKKDN